MLPTIFSLWSVSMFLHVFHSFFCTTSACSITIPNDIPSKSPVYLYKPPTSFNFMPFEPTGKVTALPIGSQLLLSCVNKNFTRTTMNSVVVNCGLGNEFEVGGRRVELRTLECNGNPTPSISQTRDACANNAGLLQLAGYQIQSGSFAAAYQMCYDLRTNRHYYSKHEINGAAIYYANVTDRYSYFRSDNTGPDPKYFEQHYGFKNVSATCRNLLGLDQNYVTNRSTLLIRGHFTPNADFILPYERIATFFYKNVAPEFHAVNNGNWKVVEFLARHIAIAYNDTLTVFTGGYETLRLPHKVTRRLVEVYLDCEVTPPQRPFLKAPLYYFKVLYNERRDVGIAFLTLNNPHATAISSPCLDICEQSRFNEDRFGNFTRGYTICCNIDNFNRIYPHLSLPSGIKTMTNPLRRS